MTRTSTHKILVFSAHTKKTGTVLENYYVYFASCLTFKADRSAVWLNENERWNYLNVSHEHSKRRHSFGRRRRTTTTTSTTTTNDSQLILFTCAVFILFILYVINIYTLIYTHFNLTECASWNFHDHEQRSTINRLCSEWRRGHI